jgi:hypothetical protein
LESFASSTPATVARSSTQDIERYGTVFNEAAWKARILAWLVHDNRAFRTLESSYLQDCFKYLNPAVEARGCLPSHVTVRNWIALVYDSHLDLVKEKLRVAHSKVHLSFDLWTSRNLKALLGVNCHFTDEFGNLKTLLLALPRQAGAHSGLNVANNLIWTIKQFGLDERIGYFVADNAFNNDTCVAALALEFGFSAKQRRLRCAGHVFNLVARAILWSTDADGFQHEL